MGLKFAPLGWTYNDGWSWNQTKTLISYDENGNRKQTDASKKCYQRGHVHLFLPTVEYSPSGSSLAYWGEQTYSFNVVDEWGPNSNDPAQNQSVRLVGKPRWYLYVEEYWRRMYIQPWDIVDETCELPCNQEITYTKRRLEEYEHELISSAPVYNDLAPDTGQETSTIDLHRSRAFDYESQQTVEIDFTDTQLDGRNDDGTAYPIPTTYAYDYEGSVGNVGTSEYVGFTDYLTQQRRVAARRLFMSQAGYRSKFMEWLAERFGDGMAEYDEANNVIHVDSSVPQQLLTKGAYGCDYILAGALTWGESSSSNERAAVLLDTVDDSSYVEFLYHAFEYQDQQTGESGETRYIVAFDEFFRLNAGRYTGFLDSAPVLSMFLRMHGLAFKDGCKLVDDETVLVPNDRTVGHVGIRFDASLPCHCLGPFMEGGEFYFFNTVVNRSMPVEYWLDEEMKTRQYFIKKGWDGFAEDGKDTDGNQTWAFSKADSKFTWVQGLFSDAREILGSDYEADSGSLGYKPYHRLPMLQEAQQPDRTLAGMNAKRLKDTVPSSKGQGGMLDNGIVRHEKYSVVPTDTASDSDDTIKPVTPIYTETDVIIPTETESSSSSPEVTRTLQWEQGGWTGWYEHDEVVRCATDGEWYVRSWKPMRYSAAAAFSGTQPYWTVAKRQAFPNPSPWLCDGKDGAERYSSEPVDDQHPSALPESFPYAQHEHWCTSMPYDNDEANRIHLLHWEYAMYFGLVRVYPMRAPEDPKTMRRRFFMYSDDNDMNPTSHIKFHGVNRGEDGEYPAPHLEERDPFDPSGRQEWMTEESLVGELAADIETLMEEYIEENGGIEDIETENAIFSEWISGLGSPYFMRYEDRDIQWHRINQYRRREITQAEIRDNNMYVSSVDQDGTEVLSPLPQPEYTVAGEDDPIPEADQNGHSSPPYRYSLQTYILFEEFRQVWTPLTTEDKKEMKLFGDTPQRNSEKYGGANVDEETLYPELSPSSPGHAALASGEEEFKRNELENILGGLDGNEAPSLLVSEFFPRVDIAVRNYNENRGQGAPEYTPSPRDEVDALDDCIESGAPIDPYRNGTVNPIETWKKYFDHREVFTIPEKTVAGGDRAIENMEGSPNSPRVHPREMSFSPEDGARRHYPEDFYVSPVIEYQKIIRKDYERPDGKESEEEWLNTEENGKPNWKSDKSGNWGDGFNITVTIPWTRDMEIQSPFSDDDHVTKPIGEYCHDCVKPERMLRHHIEFYDSLDQIRKYDFPNYVRMIHAFQRQCMPSGYRPSTPSGLPDGATATPVGEEGNYIVQTEEGETYQMDTTDFTQSLYKEDFNDYERTKKLRETKTSQQNPNPELVQYNTEHRTAWTCWQEALDEYWIRINGNNKAQPDNKYIDRPVARGMDCEGNKVQENSFERLDDGSLIWREQTTALLPPVDTVEYTPDGRPGYIDSKGNHVKGGGMVKFNNPYKEHSDGKWYEECLGAICKARCVLVLEDALGYRWQQVVEATALQPDQPIRGSDYGA